MIYLVTHKDYSGINKADLVEDTLLLLLEKGAKYDIPYTAPDTYEDSDKSWKALAKSKKLEHCTHLKFSTPVQLTEAEFVKIFNLVEVISVLQQDTTIHEVSVDLEKLSDKIMNKVIKNSQHLYNQKLEIHQPNMPLFQYNEYIVLTDCCTDNLQEDYIDKGYRVVCICPQPDQRRPDYIVARYKETK